MRYMLYVISLLAEETKCGPPFSDENTVFSGRGRGPINNLSEEEKKKHGVREEEGSSLTVMHSLTFSLLGTSCVRRYLEDVLC